MNEWAIIMIIYIWKKSKYGVRCFESIELFHNVVNSMHIGRSLCGELLPRSEAN